MNGSDKMRFSVSVVRTQAELASLRDEWCQLWQRGYQPRFFQRYAWIESAWKHQFSKRGWKLHIITAREDGRLVAVLPLALRKSLFRPNRLRYMSPLRHLEDVLLDARLARSKLGDDCVSEMVTHIEGHTRLAPVRADSNLACLLSHENVKQRQVSDAHVGYIGTDVFDKYIRGISKSQLRKEMQTLRRLSEMGPVYVQRATTSEDITNDLRWLMRQKLIWALRQKKLPRWWMRNPQSLRALNEYVVEGVAEGWATLLKLRVGNKTVAASLVFKDAEIATSIVSTYCKLPGSLTLGSAILLSLLRHQHQLGARTIDLLGTTTREKLAITDSRVAQFELHLTEPTDVQSRRTGKRLLRSQ